MRLCGALTAVVLVSIGAISAAQEEALSRITIKNAQFVDSSDGQIFHPRGFQYIRIHPEGWHYVLHPDLYAPEAVEAMFQKTSDDGFTVVRLFLRSPGTRDAEGFTSAFKQHYLDFLERARRHHIYVIPVWMHIQPESVEAAFEEEFRGRRAPGTNNRRYLSQAWIDGKAALMRELVTVVKEADPSLLSTILAYELENESAVHLDEAPFDEASGVFTCPNGKTYALDTDEDLQRLVDESTVYWANACTRAVREADPQALVSTSVFNYRLVGRSGPGKMRSEECKDPRVPLRPLALARTELDYVDVHFYPDNLENMNKSLETVEFEALLKACQERGKPLLAGEIGAIKVFFTSPAVAAPVMTTCVQRLLDSGFAGYVYWTYDCTEQEPLWHALSDGGEIYRAVRALHAPSTGQEEATGNGEAAPQ